MTFELEFGQSLFGEVLVLLYIIYIYRQLIQYMQVRTITLRRRRRGYIILLSIIQTTIRSRERVTEVDGVVAIITTKGGGARSFHIRFKISHLVSNTYSFYYY